MAQTKSPPGSPAEKKKEAKQAKSMELWAIGPWLVVVPALICGILGGLVKYEFRTPNGDVLLTNLPRQQPATRVVSRASLHILQQRVVPALENTTAFLQA